MSRKKLKYMLLFVGLLTLLLPMNAYADAAPPSAPAGSNLDPVGVTTMVQMVAEEVIVDVRMNREDLILNEYEQINGYHLDYDCTFWMMNQSDEFEELVVRFPVIAIYYETGRINIKAIQVNGESVPWTEDQNDFDGDFKWVYFKVRFPPGEEVVLHVTYNTVTTSWSPGAIHDLTYILSTGAGWYGAIGEGKIIVRFPYQPTPENVLTLKPENIEWSYGDEELVWEFVNLEPTLDDNIYIQLIGPETWTTILDQKTKIQSSPNDLSLQYELSKQILAATIYHGIDIFFDDLFSEGWEIIRNLVQLEPGNIQFHELYVEYLFTEISFDNPQVTKQLLLDEAEILLANDPESESGWALQTYAEYSHFILSDGTATSTPTVPPSPTATSTPDPTSTFIPTQPSTPTVTPTPVPDGSSENTTIIAVVAILALVGAGTVSAFRRE